MVKNEWLAHLKEEFYYLKDKALGILLFGSRSGKSSTDRSDFDICVVAPKQKPEKILDLIHQKIDVYKKRYNVYFFEELPLHLKAEVLNKHIVIVAENIPELYEYFYFYRKLRSEERRVGKECRSRWS